jgi:hypothetical protein
MDASGGVAALTVWDSISVEVKNAKTSNVARAISLFTHYTRSQE